MTGRPVAMEYSREEMYRHFRGRHKQYIDLKIGVKNDGTITAVEHRVVLDGGAYTSYGVITAYYAGSMLPTLYKIPNYKYDGTRVYTNLPASGAFRGHGVPQPRFAFESLLDMIAEELGLDPFEIRLRNAMEPNTRTGNALDISSCEFIATLERARETSGLGCEEGQAAGGQGDRRRLRRIRVRRGVPDLPVGFSALQRDDPRARGRHRRDAAHRGRGDRPGLGYRARADRRRGTRRAVRVGVDGRVRHHAQPARPRLLLEPRDADGRKRREDGGAERDRCSCARWRRANWAAIRPR